MRCLHCGSTLSAFKKLTDSDFCSTEHRDQFYTEQQRLILERLNYSAVRFQRLVRGGSAREAARVATPVPAAPELQAPAAIAAFLLAKPEIFNRPYQLLTVPRLSPDPALAHPPARRSQAVATGLLSALCPDFPWPRYNSGLKWFRDLLVEEEVGTFEFGRLLKVNGFVSTGFGAGCLFPYPQPAIASAVAVKRPFVLRMARPKPAIALGPARLAVARPAFELPVFEYRPFIRLSVIEQPLRVPFLESSPIEVTSAPAIPNSLRLRADVTARGMAFLDRVYRMRPRSGVLSPGAPAMRQVETDFLSSPGRGVNIIFGHGPMGRNSGLIPASVVRPSTPPIAAASTHEPTTVATPQIEFNINAVHPQLDPQAASTASEPRFVDRAFRFRPRGPVASDEATAGFEDLVVSQDFVPDAAYPSRDVVTDRAPAQVDRFFRPRPRGPVTREFSDFEAPASVPEPLQSHPAVCDLPRPETQFAPPALTLPFRMRPRSAVISVEVAGLVPVTEAAPLVSRPVTPPLEGATEAAPACVTRMFRMRPKSGVDTPASPVSWPKPEAIQIVQGTVAKPAFAGQSCSPGSLPGFSPELQQRFFRVRPRAGVGLESAARFENISTSPADPGVHPEIGGMAVSEAGDFAPAFFDRLFRGRPKTAVPSSGAAAQSITSSGNEAVLLAAAVPGFTPSRTDPAPATHERFFRMRPRAGVDSGTATSLDSVEVSLAASSLKPAIVGFTPGSAGDFAPAWVDRLYRGRPRTGVSRSVDANNPNALAALPLISAPAVLPMDLGHCAPPPLTKLFRFRPKVGINSVTAAATYEIEALPFPASAPEFVPDWWDVLLGPKPIFLNRMYRMRFKNPAQDESTLSQPIRTRHIPSPDPEPVLATLPKTTDAAAPSFLDRLYRMRPKAGKTLASATNVIPCTAIEPRSTSGAPVTALAFVSRQWKATPLSIKSIAATVPVLLLLVFFPFRTASLAGDHPVRQAMVRRAAVEHTDDFAEGLAHWQGVEQWKRLPSGAVQPVGLGLFKPSLEMRDYLVEFTAQIEKGGFGFVVRAADERNYQAIKLVTLKPGPLPTVAIQRYAVIDGKETNRQQTILPMTVSADTVYKVGVDVNDQSFTLMIQGKVVDFWSEEQLKTGGAGFFGAKGERALIQNLRLSHQNDTIGKLFAALTLQNVQASDGSQSRR
jgi:hypothetical protein